MRTTATALKRAFLVTDGSGLRWRGSALTEIGYANGTPGYNRTSGILSLSLNAFQARVVTT
jgi:hypothetical protein